MTPSQKVKVIAVFNLVSKGFVGYGKPGSEERVLADLAIQAIQTMIEAINARGPFDVLELKSLSFKRKLPFRGKYFEFTWCGERLYYDGNQFKQQDRVESPVEQLPLSLVIPVFQPTTVKDCFNALQELLLGINNESARIDAWKAESHAFSHDLSGKLIRGAQPSSFLSSWANSASLGQVCRQAWNLIERNMREVSNPASSTPSVVDDIAMVPLELMLSSEAPAHEPQQIQATELDFKVDVAAIAGAMVAAFATYLGDKYSQLSIKLQLTYRKIALVEATMKAIQVLADCVIKKSPLLESIEVGSLGNAILMETQKTQAAVIYEKGFRLSSISMWAKKQLAIWTEHYNEIYSSHETKDPSLSPDALDVQSFLKKLKDLDSSFFQLNDWELFSKLLKVGPDYVYPKPANMDECEFNLHIFEKHMKDIWGVFGECQAYIPRQWLDEDYKFKISITTSAGLSTVGDVKKVMRDLLIQSYQESQRLEREAGVVHTSLKTLDGWPVLSEDQAGFSKTMRQSSFEEVCRKTWKIVEGQFQDTDANKLKFSEIANMVMVKLIAYQRKKKQNSSIFSDSRLNRLKADLVKIAVQAMEAVLMKLSKPDVEIENNVFFMPLQSSVGQAQPQVEITVNDLENLITVEEGVVALQAILEQVKNANDLIENSFGKLHISGKFLSGESLAGSGFFARTWLQSELETICRQSYELLDRSGLLPQCYSTPVVSV